MSFFQGASRFGLEGNVFTHNGDVYVGSHGETLEVLRKKIERDANWNCYAPAAGTLRVPRFSKSLLLSLDSLSISIDSAEDDHPDTESCAFRLMSCLKLLPGQENEARAEYDKDVPLDSLISRGNCYCGRISRHGLIFLISQYFQHATSENTSQGGSCAVISTAIGRFKFYEIEDRTFVHFDGNTRSSYVKHVPGQELDHIIRSAQGQYMSMVNASPTNPSAGIQMEWQSDWRQVPEADIIQLATRFAGVPNGIIYMLDRTMEKWRDINRFAAAVLHAVLWVVDNSTEPRSFFEAVRSFPNESFEGIVDGVGRTSPIEKLASCVQCLRWISRHGSGNSFGLDFQSFYTYAAFLADFALLAHRHYRKSNQIELIKLIDTSRDRFVGLFSKYTSAKSTPGTEYQASLRNDIQQILDSNQNNIALIILQGYFATSALWNVSRVLERAKAGPEWWIQFVAADEGKIYIG